MIMIAGGNHTLLSRWHGEAVTEGLCGRILRVRIGLWQNRNIVPPQPLSQKSEIFDSSPYTGEP